MATPKTNKIEIKDVGCDYYHVFFWNQSRDIYLVVRPVRDQDRVWEICTPMSFPMSGAVAKMYAKGLVSAAKLCEDLGRK